MSGLNKNNNSGVTGAAKFVTSTVGNSKYPTAVLIPVPRPKLTSPGQRSRA